MREAHRCILESGSTVGNFQVNRNQQMREFLEGECESIGQQLGVLDLQDRVFQMVDFHQPYYGLLSSTMEDRISQSRHCLWGAVNAGKYQRMMEELKCAYAGVTTVDGEHFGDDDEDEQTPLIEEYRLRQDPTDDQLDFIENERAELLEKYCSNVVTTPGPRQHRMS